MSRALLVFTASLCLCGSTSSLFAGVPAFTSLAPHGGQRGTEVVINFAGAWLADTQEIVVYYPGIKATKFEVVNETALKVTLNIAPDCRLGEHVFRIRTAGGISDARTFWVGALPIVNEVEPNNEFEKPQPIPLNCTVHGGIGAEDVDYYVVECKKGQRLSVEIEGMRLGLSFWDPYIAILNEKRFELITNDDSPMLGQDSGCSILVPADGKYTIMVRESAFGGGNQYRLHIGTFPRPTGAIPCGGKPGETLDVRFVGDPLGEIQQKITLPAVADPHFRLHCTTPEGIAATGFKCQFADLQNVIESGTNTNFSVATPGPTPAAFHGIVSKNGEIKFFKFPVKKGQVWDIRTYARQLGSPLDTVLNLCDSQGGVMASNDDSFGGPDSHIRYTAPDDRDLIIGVHDHLKKGGPDYFFRVEVTPTTPRTSITMPKVDGNNQTNQDRQTLPVPRGGRNAILMNVIRSDWAGPVNLALPGLPPGVSSTATESIAGISVAPVVIEAKADAPLGGSLIELLATPQDSKIAAQSRVNHDICYILGGNNQIYHKHNALRFAFAVTEKAPYSIEVIAPKAPIPNNATYQLRVVAKREPGFTGPITISPLYVPAGFGIAPSAVIAPGAAEAFLVVNAAPNASGKWKTAITASADTAGRGLVWTSSQLFDLEATKPLATFAQERAAVDQGATAQLFGKLTITTPFTGEATVKLVGLPAKVTVNELKIGPDAKDLSFTVTTEKATAAGKQNVFAQLTAVVNGETFVQNIGGAELRVDVPLPPKVAVVPTPMGTAPPPAVKPPEKRLTRLEQLRLEQEEREKAEKAGQPAPPKK